MNIENVLFFLTKFQVKCWCDTIWSTLAQWLLLGQFTIGTFYLSMAFRDSSHGTRGSHQICYQRQQSKWHLCQWHQGNKTFLLCCYSTLYNKFMFKEIFIKILSLHLNWIENQESEITTKDISASMVINLSKGIYFTWPL